jgi:5-methylcytosine-specific restriction protein A
VYGAEFAGFIHVHHLRPLSEVASEHVVDPVADLCPVCPNCHAVIHYGGRLRSIEEVRQLLEAQRRA